MNKNMMSSLPVGVVILRVEAESTTHSTYLQKYNYKNKDTLTCM